MVQASKAEESSEARFFEIVIFSRLVQSSNAFLQILKSFSEKITDLIFVQLLNALSPIERPGTEINPNQFLYQAYSVLSNPILFLPHLIYSALLENR